MPAMNSTERLYLQLERPGFPFDIAGFAVLEAAPEGPLPFEQVRALFHQRYQQSPLMTRAVAPAPLGIGQDRWTDVGSLDIDLHMHHLRVPPPGDMDTVLAMILELSEAPLDRSRPLWDAWYLTGMAEGISVLLVRTHHASIDGMGIMQLQRILYDSKPTPVDPNQLAPPFGAVATRPSCAGRSTRSRPGRHRGGRDDPARQAGGTAVPDLARSTVGLAWGTMARLGALVGSGPSDPSRSTCPSFRATSRHRLVTRR